MLRSDFVGRTRQCQEFADETYYSQPPGATSCLVNAGIIAHADLSLGAAVGPILDAHCQFDNFRGIRDSCSVTDDPLVASHGGPVGKLYDEKFREGMAELGKRGLTFESWSFHLQLPVRPSPERSSHQSLCGSENTTWGAGALIADGRRLVILTARLTPCR